MFNLFKKKDIILDVTLAPKVENDKFSICVYIKLEDIYKVDKRLYKLLHKFEAEVFTDDEDNIFVDYNDFVECVLFYNRSGRYSTFIELVENKINVLNDVNKNIICSICEKIHDKKVNILKEEIEADYDKGKFSQEQYNFLQDYINYIISMSVIQELSIVEMCEIAYQYIVKNKSEIMESF